MLAALEAGTPPWCREWKARGRGNVPQNAITRRPYSGVNTVLLWMQQYPQQKWMTFGQALAIGANVRKGEKSTCILYVNSYEKKKQ
jgi:antirestriction protein ArdC